MIFSLGHGEKLQWISAATRRSSNEGELQNIERAADPDVVPVARAIPDAAPPAAGATESALESALEADIGEGELFGYLFPDAEEIGGGDQAAALAALATAMAEAGEGAGGDTGDAEIAPVMTYFGQFIDHDITAGTNTDAVTDALRIGGAAIVPANRSLVVTGLKNLRKGSLGLDSVYGDGPIPGPMQTKLQAALRDPVDPDRLRVGELDRLNGTTPPTARVAGADNALDLPRVGSIVGSAEFPTPADLPATLRPTGPDDVRWDRRAFIGDSRNDENLVVAQTHVAFLKLHNAFVARGMDFAAARRATTWHYQWLIVNAFLPAIGDAATLAAVAEGDAPVYQRFYDARRARLPVGALPIPLEFSAAAFRFGHSMVRAEYDWNANFMRGGAGTVPCTFDFLFAFTGNHTTPIGRGGNARLPDNWPIDWARFVRADGPRQQRARRVDTRIAPPLFEMVNETTASGGLFQRLAERNLKRGHVLNLPSAQALIAKLAAVGAAPSVTLSAAEIASGPTGAAVTAGGFDGRTPLWFYVLKEAELHGAGGRLGPLGTRIVAETLIGLLVNDTGSYWSRAGGKWSPDEAASGGPAPIRSMADMFRAAGVL